MELVLDSESYTEQQEILIGEIILSIKDTLEEVGIIGDVAKEATIKLAFKIACDLDATAGIEFDGIEVNPLVTFIGENKKLIHCGGSSYMHKYVHGITCAVFGENS